MRYLLAGAVILAMVWISPAQAADQAVFAGVDRYAARLGAFEAGDTKRGSLEDVYHNGLAVAATLVPVLESLTPEEYASVAGRLRGFLVNRDEVVFVLPDFRFFSGVAKKQGTDADAAFFSFMAELRPDNVWPAFIERQTDYGGCTAFGTGVLTRLYGKATGFGAAYRSAYRIDMDEVVRQLRDELTESACACGDEASVVREFEQFIAAFPAADATPAVRKRLLDVKGKRSSIRFNCTAG